jgi:predicted O-linked N-acetylglucosamine transferase (SPINDLY family)
MGFHLMQRVFWLYGLSPQEYLTLLAAGDLMVDPFPFGGGVTTLEALAVCTPVMTAPELQSVPGACI